MDILFLDLPVKPLRSRGVFLAPGLALLVFALSAMQRRVVHRQTALSLVLIVIGSNLFAAGLPGIATVPPALPLGVTAAILIGGVVLSLWQSRKAPAFPQPVAALEPVSE